MLFGSFYPRRRVRLELASEGILEEPFPKSRPREDQRHPPAQTFEVMGLKGERR